MSFPNQPEPFRPQQPPPQPQQQQATVAADATFEDYRKPELPSVELVRQMTPPAEVLQHAVPGTWLFDQIHTAGPTIAAVLLTRNFTVSGMQLQVIDPVDNPRSTLVERGSGIRVQRRCAKS